MDMKSWTVWTKAKPQYKTNHTNNEEESQENGAYYLGDPGGEAFLDPVGVVAGSVVALNGSGVPGIADGYSGLRVHFV